jgi:hypothetical protein
MLQSGVTHGVQRRDATLKEVSMTISIVQPTIDANALLAGAQFIDAFSVTTDATTMTARQAAERMLGHSPRWVEMLMSLRDLIVTPFGLTTTKSARHAPVDKIGIFPVLDETPHQLIAGFDDSHLDFRVVIDVTAFGSGHRVTATTVVLTHNWLGRSYLTIIKPFHRLVVRSMLRQVPG